MSTPTQEQQEETPLHERVRRLMREEAVEPLHDLLTEADTVELVGALYAFSTPEQHFLLQMMGDELAAELLPVLNESSLAAVLELVSDEHLVDLVEMMEPDDAAHVFACLESGRAAALLGSMEPEQRKSLENLLSYSEDTAGRIMDPDLVRVRVGQTAAEALDDIRSYVSAVELDEFFTIYLVDETGVLVGSIPVWQMLLALPDQPVESLMTGDVISVEAHLDQEKVSQIVRDHDLVSVPVVDHRGRLVGRITVDDVVDVIHEEFHEDMAQFAGTGSQDPTTYSISASIRARSPWLFFAAIGLSLSALIMSEFELLFIEVPRLAFFVPLVMAMGGNAGIQSSSLVIRGLATGEVQLRQFWRRCTRELAVATGIGGFFAALLLAGVGLLTGDWRLGITVGLATAAGIATAAVIGTTIPMALKRIDLDPALATGPFLTTLNDMLGILVYLGVAFLILF